MLILERYPVINSRGFILIEIKDLLINFYSGRSLKINDLEIPSLGSGLIYGGNGSGKTTLVRCILGLHHEFSGSIKIDGKDPRYLGRREIASFISYLPQLPGPDTDFKIDEFIKQGLYSTGKGYFDEVVDLLNLGPYLKRRFSELSGGEKQIARIARALVPAVRYSFLDEPDSYLSRKNRNLLFNSIMNFKDRRGIVIISHADIVTEQNVAVLLEMGDDV
jgi:iron complex transport system ATP-binding protein